METEITEHIKRMGDIRSNYDRWSGLGLTPNEAKAFDFAIEAMHKCQKIKKILDTNVVYSDSDFMMLSAIKRVVDGDMQEDKFWKFIDEV